MSKKTVNLWWQGFRTALPFAVLVVLAFVIRWTTWNEAWQAGAIQGAQRGYIAGQQSCPSRTSHGRVIIEDTSSGYRDSTPQGL